MDLLKSYDVAKEVVKGRGFIGEISFASTNDFEHLTEHMFLREYAWVVLSSGMSNRVITHKWPAFRQALGGFSSAKDITENYSSYYPAALKVFGHRLKINSIFSVAEDISRVGFSLHKSAIRDRGIYYLEEAYPFIGPITRYHLGKNIGLQVAKPDRHLVRIARACGFTQTKNDDAVMAFCGDISKLSGDSIPVVDTVLWRYATLNPDYLSTFI